MRLARAVRRTFVAASVSAVVAAVGVVASPAAYAGPGRAANGSSATSSGSLATIAARTGATDLWACGWTGRGVDVALVDTGVAPVAGTGAIVSGPDLSFEAQAGAPRSLDGDGHGTHLASIINGRDAGFSVDRTQCRLDPVRRAAARATRSTGPTAHGFSGIAPDARIVNVKVGDADGAADVTQVIAAIDWVVQHRDTEGRNIRVLALAYAASDPQGDWRSDPLSHAVDIARRNGIVVVAAAGNDGSTSTELAFPAQNPNIVAVNAVDYHGSADPSDWTVADFSSRGSNKRGADLIAPGVSVEGLAVPGSVAALANPTSFVDGRFIKGTGTSQATAITAGLAALLVQRYPHATPAQVKAMLVDSAKTVNGAPRSLQGAGVPVADRLLVVGPSPSTKEPEAQTTGTAPIDGLRTDGTAALGEVALHGEIDAQGQAWDAQAWASGAAAGTTWQDGSWRGREWSGDASTGWQPTTWATSWDPAVVWADVTINAPVWDGIRWAGDGWAGIRWAGIRWAGIRWAGIRWAGIRWAGYGWASASWT